MNIFSKLFNILKLIGILSTITLVCSACNQSPQERNGISLLPHNRPTASELRPTIGNSLRY
ncbi:MAG TPA: hypothetical protein QF753_00100 [Victivallales bacterium]|nr:hypothetical protein [Victivallales bacterium]